MQGRGECQRDEIAKKKGKRMEDTFFFSNLYGSRLYQRLASYSPNLFLVPPGQTDRLDFQASHAACKL